ASQRPVFLLNSRLGLFTAAYSKSKHPFSRSYGVILPSSLTRVLPLTCGYSPCLPVSVSGTGTRNLTRGFSWQCGIKNFSTLFPSPSQIGIVELICLFISLAACTHTSIGAILYPPASPHRSNNCQVVQEYQPVIHRLRLSASAYVPTNPEWTNLPQESLGFRCKRFSLFFRYFYPHSNSQPDSLVLT